MNGRISVMTQPGRESAAQLIQSIDWAKSPLGPLAAWPLRLQTLLNLMLDAKFPMFVAWGPELTFLYNDAYSELLGGKHPAAMGSRMRDIWAEIWVEIAPIVDQTLAGHSTYREHVPFALNRKGYPEQAWFTFSYSPVRTAVEEVNGIYCVCTETTRQIFADRQRRTEIAHLKDLFRQAPGMVVVLRDAHHVIELANDAYSRFFGNRELIGKAAREALTELDNQGFLDLLDHVYSTGQPYIGKAVPIQVRTQAGGALEERFIDFIYQPIRGADDEVTGIFAQGNDVTEAVRAAEAMRESEQRLRVMANTIPQLVWVTDADGSMKWFNDRWYEYTGTTFEQIQGSGWQVVHHPDTLAAVQARWEASLASGEPFEMAFPLRSARGEYRMFFTRVAPLRDKTGKIVQWFGTNTDIDEIEKTQAELRAANRRKDEFLAMLAHELRNPLAPISTAAKLINSAATGPAQIRAASAIIARQVTHMTELIDELLDVSRLTRGRVQLQLELVNVKAAIAEAVEQVNALLEIKRHHLTVQMANESAYVQGDKTRLVQVIANILNNAAKYTPEHGHIALHLRVDAELVEVCIEDDGVGMDANLLPHLFDLFTQAERPPDRSQGGLGLGLALVKSLVELHGGSVSACSAGAGKGSKFSITLPRAVDAVEPPIEVDSRAISNDARRAASVMIVDDNVDAAETLGMLLSLHGYEAVVAHHPLEALDQAALHHPEVMILDIGLPEMDGYELARRVRGMPELDQSLLIAATGYGRPEDRRQALAAGFAHHLVKPVELDKLLAILADIEA